MASAAARLAIQSENAPALILRWQADYIEVLCPFCGSVHRHILPRCGVTLPRPGISCSVAPEHARYTPCYPWEYHDDDRSFGWELDKVGMILRTVSRRKVGSGPSLSLELTGEGSHRAIVAIDDIVAGSQGTGQQRPKPLFIDSLQLMRACVALDLERIIHLQRALHTSVTLLVDELGNNAIHHALGSYAAAVDLPGGQRERSLDIASQQRRVIAYLRSNGVDIDRQNYRGQTPLMSAAMLGSLPAVHFLARNGANTERQDDNGRTALDLAESEDADVLGEVDSFANSNSLPVDEILRRRTDVVLWLWHFSRREKKLRQCDSLVPHNSSLFVVDDEGRLSLRDLSGFRTVAQPRRYQHAIAQLFRCGVHGIQTMVNGYVSNPGSSIETLESDYWQRKATVLGRYLGHTMTRPSATHVEKRLVAYYIDRRIVHARDTPEVLRLAAVLGAELPDPVIIATSEQAVCPDCLTFIEKARARFSIPITICCVGQEVPDSLQERFQQTQHDALSH